MAHTTYELELRSQLIAKWFDKRLIKSLKTENVPNIADSGSMNRLKIVLDYYHSWVENEVQNLKRKIHSTHSKGYGIYTFLTRTLPNYSAVKLIDDYNDIIFKYSNQFTLVHYLLSTDIAVNQNHIKQSYIFRRNNRDRQLCAIGSSTRCSTYFGWNGSDEVSTQKLLDKIYCHLILPYQSGYMLTQNEVIKIATQEIEINNLKMHDSLNNQTQTIDEALDNPLKIICKVLREKNLVFYEIRGSQRMQMNKFVTSIDSDDYDEKNNSNNTMELDFGYKFRYWKSYKYEKWFISKKYGNLKSEITRNVHCKLSDKQFEDLIKMAIIYIHSKRGRKLQCKYANTSISYGEPNIREIGIRKKHIISIDHMLSVLIFCNFDILRNEFIGTFINKNNELSDEQFIQRHSEYYHFAKLLYETIRLYGMDISKHGGFHQSFYHSIDRAMIFNEFHTYLNRPTSTTSSLTVAVKYSMFDEEGFDGLILEMEKDLEFVGDQHYFDCAWLSDFGAENEKIFSNIMLRFKSILYPKLYHNYGKYLNVFNVLQSMLIGTELTHQTYLTAFIPKLLTQILDIHSAHELPNYFMDLFDNFRRTVEYIELNVWLMIIDSYEMQLDDDDAYEDCNDGNGSVSGGGGGSGYGCHSENEKRTIKSDGNLYGYQRLYSLFIDRDGWIHWKKLCDLFPETEHIHLYNGNVQTKQILPCIKLNEMFVNFLLNSLSTINNSCKLKKISWYFPDETQMDCRHIIKHFQMYFKELKWELVQSIDKSPFLPDISVAVNTISAVKL